jgi:hypothetical protein
MESSVQNYENDNDDDPERLFLNSIKSNATKHMYLYQTFSPNWKNWDFWKATKGQDSDGRQSSGERKRYWKGVRLVTEYLLQIEQTTID